MPPKIDLIGKRFGRLLVLSENGRTKTGKVKWLCICDCGSSTTIKSQSLLLGTSQSCGCLHREQLVERNTKHGLFKGGGKWPEGYGIWSGMKDRCYNPNHPKYADYGGRGIGICRRWLHSFVYFMEDMGPRPSKRHSIDRIRNNGNYTPKNCRWALPGMQAANTRKNIWVRFMGRKMIIRDWANEIGITQQHLRALLRDHSIKKIYEKYKR